MADFSEAVKKIFRLEGGYSDNPNDSGGRTNYGITEAVARNHGLDVDTITRDEAEHIYYSSYWDPCGANLIEDQRLATVIFDCAVNCGVFRAVIFLQAILFEDYDERISVDGVFGPQTLGALDGCRRYWSGITACYLAKRRNYYREIAQLNSKNLIFLKGWYNRLGEL